MVELHGWLSIWETYEDEDNFPQAELDEIMRKAKDISRESGLELRYMNGVPFISTTLYANHRTAETDTILETYRKIARTASGSYGAIYLRDDEDAEHFNEFRVYVFKRGTCACKTAEDFSPCITEIEARD